MTKENSSKANPVSLALGKISAARLFFLCALASTFVSFIWICIPDDTFSFSKTSLLGYFVISIFRVVLCLILPIAYVAFHADIPEKEIVGTNPGIGVFLMCFLLGCPAGILFVSTHNLSAYFCLSQKITVASPAYNYVSQDSSKLALVLLVLMAYVIPIIAQELFFRGVFFEVFQSKAYGLARNVLAALFFSAYMLSPVDFLAYFLLGLALSIVRRASNNVFCPILTQFGMLLTYALSKEMLPYLDLTSVSSLIDLDATVLYTSLSALLISLLSFFPVLSQIQRSGEKPAPQSLADEKKPSFTKLVSFSWPLVLGLLLFTAQWVLLLDL